MVRHWVEKARGTAVLRIAGLAMFTEALDPPDFGRIGHPALTVALWITSREP
jgi:hypothetical protein